MRQGMRIRFGFAWLVAIELLAACQSRTKYSATGDANVTSLNSVANDMGDYNMSDMNVAANAAYQSEPKDDNEVGPPPR